MKQVLTPFVLSLAFLPLPIILGGSFLREVLSRIQSIIMYGWGVGDSLLVLGMSAGIIFLIVVPLAGFAWGQVLAWSRRAYASSTIALYACLSLASAAFALAVIRSALG